MMHFSSLNVRSTGKPCSDADFREAVAAVETWRSRVRDAKYAADESLMRLREAPGPHETTNLFFVALHEAHQRDREALFAAMRRLDCATEALRAIERETSYGPRPIDGGYAGDDRAGGPEK